VLDATEYFCSQKIECPNCSSRARANGRTEHFHAMVSAALVAPGHERALPLEPEFIAPRDGAEKQDCEARAAHRWLAAHGPKYARLNPIYLGDDGALAGARTPASCSPRKARRTTFSVGTCKAPIRWATAIAPNPRATSR